MHLKRLELFGFKSFADRTVLAFDSALTGIVGPNGCGKSNVVDAVRWVLGETRPTSMRGGEMSDVIFKGSSSRPALSVAEVTIVLDNQDGGLEGRGAEVALTRRVFKDGEGEYLVDGEKARLKDLKGLLYDTGLGSRGYAVLEQGRIDAVLSADPLERRAIFEEAAGISRHRVQRREIAARLERVAQDLLRLEDVVRELATRSRSLKIQAGRAERYAETREAWRAGALALYRHQALALAAALAGSSERLAEREAHALELRGAREQAEEQARAAEREEQALAADVERVSAELSELVADLRARDERGASLGSRGAAAHARAAEESARAEEQAARLAERTAEIERLAADRAALETGSRAAAESALARGRELEELAARARAAGLLAEEQARALLVRLGERTESENAVHHLEGSLQPLSERARRAVERAAEIGAARTEAVLAVARCESDVTACTERLAAIDGARRAGEEDLRRLDERATELHARRSELELERARARSKAEALTDFEREKAGLAPGSQAALAHAAAEPEAARLFGFLADHLRTGTRNARALDAVLGDRAQALVAADAAAALALLAWLEREQVGAARVVVAGGLGSRAARLDASARAEVERRGGTWLLERVKVDRGYERLAELLLADVALVDDRERALELVAAVPGLCCATIGGDVIDATGALGGWREIAQGPVGRRASADELSDACEALTREVDRVAAEMTAHAAERGELAEGLAAREVELERARTELARARERFEVARVRAAELEDARALAEHESRSLAASRERAEADLARARAARDAAATLHAQAAAALAEAERAKAELHAARERAGAVESEARVSATRLAAELEAARRRGRDLEGAREEARSELERTHRLRGEQAELAVSCAQEVERLAEARTGLLERRGTLEHAQGELRRLEREGKGAAEARRARAEAATRSLEALSEEVGALRLELQRHELARAEIVRRALEELAIAEGELVSGFDPDPALAEGEALAALAARVAEQKRELDKLGPVNLEAIEELRTVSERLAFLTGQRDDVLASRRSLEEALARIGQESERMFLAAFEQIRGNFRGIFRRLFGGGNADIELVTGAAAGAAPGAAPGAGGARFIGVLEAGIEITARPPGRETLPIGLLSGGQRTLTALALLFAVFQARPSPFCLLDEVDAALDDVNVGRFLDMLGDFLEKTQFIVVTHNKGTMSACQRLYGITMEVRGVSKQVSVELSDVDRYVPDAIGTVIERPDMKVVPRPTPPRAAPARHADRSDGTSAPESEPEPGETEPGDPEAGDPVAAVTEPAEPVRV